VFALVSPQKTSDFTGCFFVLIVSLVYAVVGVGLFFILDIRHASIFL